MAQTLSIGRVAADIEPQTSVGMNTYVRFGLAEHIGYGDFLRTQYIQVWAWGNDAKRLIKGKVKKGSLIWVSGQLELEEFIKKDGITADKRLKVTLDNWGYISSGKPKENAAEDTLPCESYNPPPEIDGDREELPG